MTIQNRLPTPRRGEPPSPDIDGSTSTGRFTRCSAPACKQVTHHPGCYDIFVLKVRRGRDRLEVTADNTEQALAALREVLGGPS